QNQDEAEHAVGESEFGQAIARQAAEENVPHHDSQSYEGAVEEVDAEGPPGKSVGIVRPLKHLRNPPDGQLDNLGSRLERGGNHPEVRKQHHPDPQDGEKGDEQSPVTQQHFLIHSKPPRRKRRRLISVSTKTNAKSTIDAAAASPMRK